MKDDKKVPQLRFPEFTDAWKQRKLGEIIDYSNGIGHENYVLPQGKYELVTLKSINSSGKLVCSEKFVNEDFETLKAETLIMMLSEQAKGMLGMTTIIPCDNKYVLNQRVAALKAHNDVEVHFLTNAINNKQNYFEQMGAGTKVQNITRGHVEECVIELPSLEEQKKIGSLFSKLEVTITLQQRKLNSLQKLKKGLLQKMFPKNGENIPEIRFPEFSDAWKQRKFGEFVERKSDSALSSTSIPSVEYENVESETGILKKDIYVKTEFKKGVLFSDKDVLYGKLRPYLHNWLAPSFTGVAVGDWWVLSPKNCSKDFLYRLLQTLTFDEIANQTSGTKMPRADWNLVSSTAFYIPSSIEEQAKIGSLFNRIDSTITLQQRKLESLQKLKKGLLQQMFI